MHNLSRWVAVYVALTLLTAAAVTLMTPLPSYANHSGPSCQGACEDESTFSCNSCQTHCGEFGCCTYDCGGSLVNCQECPPPV